ncbi:transposase [Streptomyces virginiae]
MGSGTSWCQLLDAVRLAPAVDLAEVTAAQGRRVVVDLMEMGSRHLGDRNVLIVFDDGYDAPCMAQFPAGLPSGVLGRMRTDRVMRKPVPVPWTSPPQGGRPPKLGQDGTAARWPRLPVRGECGRPSPRSATGSRAESCQARTVPASRCGAQVERLLPAIRGFIAGGGLLR